MNISKQFEYIDSLYIGKERKEVPKFVTILDEFEHHYTGIKMYRIRIEYASYITESYPVVEYETLQERYLLDMFKLRKV